MIELFKPIEKKRGAGVDYVKLMIFAYIYSFSRDGKSKWYGKQQTLAKMVGCGEKAMYQKLKEMVDDGLIIKEEVQLYGMFHHNNYWVNLDNIVIPSETTPMVSETPAMVSENTSMDSENTNNKSNYKSIDNSINSDIYDSTTSNESEEVLNPSSSLIKNNIDIDKGASSRRPPNIQVIPTREEVREYFNKKGFKSNPDDFYDWYEAGDWKNDNGSFIRWKQKAISWDKREYKSKEQRRKKYTNIPQTEITMEYAGEHNEL